MTKEAPERESQELRRRLAEAEDALRAIREGQVDAIVVEGAAGAQIFSLAGAEAVYRLVVETMVEATINVSPEGTIMFCNASFCELVATPMESVLGHNLAEFVAPGENARFQALLQRCRNRPVRQRVVFLAPNGTQRAAHVTGTALGEGQELSLCLVATDLTDLESSAHQIRLLRDHQRRLKKAYAELGESRRKALDLMNEAQETRRHAEDIAETLRKSEERFRLAEAAAGAGSWDWDIASGQIEWSAEQFRILGLDPTQASAGFDAWRAALHPQDKETAEERLEQAIRDRTLLDNEYRIILPSGDIRWVRVLGNTVYDDDGKPLRMSGIMLDITARRQAEAELERTRSTLAEAQKIAHLGSFEYIAATRATLWSEEEYHIYGLDPAGPSPEYDVMLRECIHPDDAALLDETFIKAMETSSIYELEHRVVWPDGTVRWVYDRAHPHCDDKGNILRYVGATLDITQRKEAEDSLRQSERRFRQVAESLPQLVWTCAADGPCDYLSPQWMRFTGKTEAEHLGYGWLDQLHPDDRQRTIDQWLATVPKGESFEIEFRLRRHDGEYRWFRSLAVPLRDETGSIVKWFGSNTDVDDMMRSEAALLESERKYRALAEENARLYRQQLVIAENLQLALLNIPSEIGRLKVSHIYRSATEAARVGGDFYDLFELRDGKVGIPVGDVSGHGVEAARIAALTKDVIHAFSHLTLHPGQALGHANRLLVDRSVPGFVTAFLGILDPASETLEYTSAGHPDALLRHPSGEITALSGGSPPLGVFPDASWESRTIDLTEGDLLLIYTDGIIEARRDSSFFGEERLQALLRRKRISVDRLPQLILDQVLSFSRGVLLDDVAILAISLGTGNGDPGSGRSRI